MTPVSQTVWPCSALAALRYYEGSDSCRPSPRAAGLPAYLATSSRRSASNHVVHPGIALHAITSVPGEFRCFAMNEQARRYTPPNRVRHPADRQFASSCSPPRLAATQLPSTTGPWLTLTQTFTVQMWRLHGRTHPGNGRCTLKSSQEMRRLNLLVTNRDSSIPLRFAFGCLGEVYEFEIFKLSPNHSHGLTKNFSSQAGQVGSNLDVLVAGRPQNNFTRFVMKGSRVLQCNIYPQAS